MSSQMIVWIIKWAAENWGLALDQAAIDEIVNTPWHLAARFTNPGAKHGIIVHILLDESGNITDSWASLDDK